LIFIALSLNKEKNQSKTKKMINFLRKNAVLAVVLTTTLAHTVMAFVPSTPAFVSASKRSLSSSTLVAQKMAGAELSEFSDYTENNNNFNWNEYSKKRRSTSYEVPGKSTNNKDNNNNNNNNNNNEKKKIEASKLNSLESTEKMDLQSSSLSSSKEQAQKSENNNINKTRKKNTKKSEISSTTLQTQTQTEPRPPGVNVDYMRLPKSQSNARPYPKQKQKQKVSNPNDLEYMRKGFEMRWQLMGSLDECKLEEDMHSCGGECDMCHGAGKSDCRFCNGTGFSMLSDGTMLSQGKPCLVCSGVGEEPCKGCGGSGWVANWRGLAP